MYGRRGRRDTTLRRYGYFRCSNCNAHWESSHTYKISHSVEKYYKQDCKKCNIGCEPYRVERLICSGCGMRDCKCTSEEKAARHVDPNKPHMSALCHKCRSGHPC
uniref:Zygote arrest protein 1-like n=1 Tax=Crassostrea virginica TaxID=6565 RepID=A0A8B8CTQ7_CRAVI|nr:zygote arrest protein 1-like [Crassostrea virginica]